MRTLLLTVALSLSAFTTAAFANVNIAQNDNVVLSRASNGPNSGQIGGAFEVKVYSDDNNDNIHVGNTPKDSFTTFCVELTKTISLGTTYNVNAIDPLKNSSPGSPNLTTGFLTAEAAWLYTQFLDNNAAEFDNENNVQYGIWIGMGYDPTAISNLVQSTWTAPVLANAVSAVNGWFSSQSLADWKLANPTGFGGIQIMQLGIGNVDNQDQLVRLVNPEPVMTPTPEPTTLAIWGGLATLGLAVRAYRRQA